MKFETERKNIKDKIFNKDDNKIKRIINLINN